MGLLRSGPTTALLVAVLALGGCTGGGEPPDGTTTPGGTATPALTTTPTGSAGDGDRSDGLPGESFDAGPQAGARLAVVGVSVDDVLNLRIGPGVEFQVVSELAPLETDVMATGRGRVLDDGRVWVEATVDGVTGWANLAYLAYLGGVDDITSRLGTPAGGSELVDVAEAVAEQWAGDPEGWTLTVVDGPYNGAIGEVTTPGEITVDVLGMGDDSVLGARLHIFATPDGGRFTARTVEATRLCARGVSGELCL